MPDHTESHSFPLSRGRVATLTWPTDMSVMESQRLEQIVGLYLEFLKLECTAPDEHGEKPEVLRLLAENERLRDVISNYQEMAQGTPEDTR